MNAPRVSLMRRCPYSSANEENHFREKIKFFSLFRTTIRHPPPMNRNSSFFKKERKKSFEISHSALGAIF
jgi:hypothetical protein